MHFSGSGAPHLQHTKAMAPIVFQIDEYGRNGYFPKHIAGSYGNNLKEGTTYKSGEYSYQVIKVYSEIHTGTQGMSNFVFAEIELTDNG